MNKLTYGEALEAAKQGKLISREGWNGKGMFVFKRPEDTLNIGVLLGLRSLPKNVKDYYEGKHQPIVNADDVKVTFTAYLCMKAADDTIVNGWLASQTDMLSNDWCILD